MEDHNSEIYWGYENLLMQDIKFEFNSSGEWLGPIIFVETNDISVQMPIYTHKQLPPNDIFTGEGITYGIVDLDTFAAIAARYHWDLHGTTGDTRLRFPFSDIVNQNRSDGKLIMLDNNRNIIE